MFFFFTSDSFKTDSVLLQIRKTTLLLQKKYSVPQIFVRDATLVTNFTFFAHRHV